MAEPLAGECLAIAPVHTTVQLRLLDEFTHGREIIQKVAGGVSESSNFQKNWLGTSLITAAV
jgi:hypothetical protein